MYSVDVEGQYAYVKDGVFPRELHVIDLQDLASPKIVGTAEFTVNFGPFEVQDGYVYMAGYGGLFLVFDATDPTDPTLLTQISTSGKGYAEVFILGDYAYHADGNSGINIISIADPSAPEIVGSYSLDNLSYNALFVRNGWAFVSTDDGNQAGYLRTVDVSKVDEPAVVGESALPYAGYEVDLFQDYAFVAVHQEGVEIVGVAPPEAPVSAETITTFQSSIQLVKVDSSHVYAAAENSGEIEIAKVSGINTLGFSAPVVTTYDQLEEIKEFVVVDGHLFVADYNLGLVILRVDGCW